MPAYNWAAKPQNLTGQHEAESKESDAKGHILYFHWYELPRTDTTWRQSRSLVARAGSKSRQAASEHRGLTGMIEMV